MGFDDRFTISLNSHLYFAALRWFISNGPANCKLKSYDTRVTYYSSPIANCEGSFSSLFFNHRAAIAMDAGVNRCRGNHIYVFPRRGALERPK